MPVLNDDSKGEYSVWLQWSFLVLEVFSGDTVESSSSLTWKDTGVNLKLISFLVFLDEFLLLQLLKAPSDDLGWGVLVEFRSAFSSLESSVNMGKETDTWARSEVDLSCEGSNTVIEPIFILRSKLISCIRNEILVLVLTRSTQAGLSIRLFFLRYWAKASMNSWADKSLTVKKVCLAYPNIDIMVRNIY